MMLSIKGAGSEDCHKDGIPIKCCPGIALYDFYRVFSGPVDETTLNSSNISCESEYRGQSQ